MKTIFSLFSFGSARVVREAAKSERRVATAVVEVNDAEAALNSARAEALSTIRSEEAAVSAALTEHDAREATREEERADERREQQEADTAIIQAMEETLNQARRDAAANLTSLDRTQRAERARAAANEKTASDALARLKAIEAQLAGK